MELRRLLGLLSFLFIVIVMITAYLGTPGGVLAEVEPSASALSSLPLTIHMNLGPADPIIDPIYAIHGGWPSIFLANQMFLGLLRIDDVTGELVNDLATSWTISPDGTIYTFTLRGGVSWTDGTPLTASDVRYGMLRTLEFALDTPSSSYGHLLYIVENGEGYADGSVVDPDDVGIEVLSPTQIKFTLIEEAAYFPYILATLAARPLPSWAIAAHGTAWTEPGNIVSNGPYRLSSWSHGSELVLMKNGTYYNAGNVEIDYVHFSMLDYAAAWDEYLLGNLDTVEVPYDEWTVAKADPVLQHQIYAAPSGCTETIGFNTARPPFDDPLVRQAFIAAIDRQGVIDDVLLHDEWPALTFTPPLHWGHIDGPSEGVGIPYNPTQAQAYLAASSYSGGLPAITYVYNDTTKNAAVAAAYKQDWFDTFGVSVALDDISPFADYLDLLRAPDPADRPQVWRLGWCGDYQDAYCNLEGFVYQWVEAYGDWVNLSYDGWIASAVAEPNLTVRRTYYKNAEEILVESDAIMGPIYYFVTGWATKPYLDQTYGRGGWGDFIEDWRIKLPAPVDFLADGVSELIVFRNGAWRFFDYDTASFDHGVWTGSFPGCIPAPMDYDGDGGDEPTLFCSGAWHFFHNNGAYNKGIWTGGVPGDLPVPADYDGDGTDDVVVWRAGAWRFFDFTTATFDHGVWTGSPPHWLGGTNIPMPMDYDGDGAAEFTVFSGGPWHFYNDDGTYLKGFWTGGVAGDLPVPADYNGDGHEEVVVWRTGAWRFFDFATGAFDHGVWTGTPPHWLGGTSLPAPVDYNGDGLVDFTVFSGGPWHFYNDDGIYVKGIWTGGVAGDLALSRRLLP